MAVEQIDLTQDDSDSDSGAESVELNFRFDNGIWTAGEQISTPSRNRTDIIDLERSTIRNPSPSTQASGSRAPISPPPVRRSAASILDQIGIHLPSTQTSNSNYPSTEPVIDSPRSIPKDLKQNVPDMARLSGVGFTSSLPLHVAPRSPPLPPKARSVSKATTPKSQTSTKLNTDVPKLIDSLTTFRQDIKKGHSQLVTYIIDSIQPPDYRCKSGRDLFANIKSRPADKAVDGETVRVRFKQHSKSKKDPREEHHPVIRIKSEDERVPPYRNHHVETKRNVLTRGTMLTFVPHVRDLDSSEENKYNAWLKKLEEIDRQSGFKPMDASEKLLVTIRTEIAATVSLYLEDWLEKLAIPGFNKSALIRYTVSRETAMTPQQKTDILKSHYEGDDAQHSHVRDAARMFTAAFNHVFGESQPLLKQIDLQKVLLLDEVVDSILEPKPTAKDGSGDKDGGDLSQYLGTYWNLGCAICFSHACDHGEYNIDNYKMSYSIPGRVQDALSRRRRRQLGATEYVNGDAAPGPCHRNCHQTSTLMAANATDQAWSEDERMVLRSVYATADHSRVKRDPICLVANFLDRDCSDVYRESQSLSLRLPAVEALKKSQIRSLTWYDRYKKCLIGDWQQYTKTHDIGGRETPEPCAHDGPCTQENCTCVQKGLLCEKLCDCTVDCCAYKFTGCACHSQGKCCVLKQKERPCICVQLNRECDPDLCGTCGALERADPENAKDDMLHLKGCQNCVLQRGVSRALILGQSQLEGCGYGLFTAVDIPQDGFVIEYVGELITHDEGVRREARRGDVFDNEEAVSYVFTLLENEGIWVDAATYGNLSRFINHAAEGETRGCNIAPRVLYVNGEYRIKFFALRDIKAGEELFFNYGEHFPNLTKKLLDAEEKDKPSQPKKRGRRPRKADDHEVARKAPKADKKKHGNSRTSRKETTIDLGDDEIATQEWLVDQMQKSSRKRKRGGQDDSEEEEYQPTGTDATGSRAESPSSVDSDEPVTKSLERLRKRARKPKDRALGGPEKPRGPPKTRGKRGGARPGSGRPRKHPRPVPKPIPVAEEQQTAVPLPTIAENALPKQPEVGQHHSEDEAEDSEDGRDYSMMDDHDEEETEDDDDDDEPIVSHRHRQDRQARTRRIPSKFRNDEVWDLN